MTTTSWSDARLAAVLVPTSPAPMMTTCMQETSYPRLKFVTIGPPVSRRVGTDQIGQSPPNALGSAHEFRPETVRCGNGIEMSSSSNRSLTAFT